MLETEIQYFESNIQELIAKYPNRFLVIIGNQVVGDYDSEAVAYSAAAEKFEIGTFLIREATSEVNDQKQVFHSRVIFA
jgi:hypothetical protein